MDLVQVQVGTSSWQYAGKRVGIELNPAIKIRGNQSGFTGTNTNTLAGGRNLGQSIQSGGNLVIQPKLVELTIILFHVNIKIQM